MVPAGSRALLIGVSHYQDAAYQSYPAVGNSLLAMAVTLADVNICGWPIDSITAISNPINAARLIGYLRKMSAETTGVLLSISSVTELLASTENFA